MKFNNEEFAEFVQAHFGGNFNECGRKIKVAASTAWRVAHGYNKAGLKFITCVIDYCNENNVSYSSMIFLDKHFAQAIN